MLGTHAPGRVMSMIKQQAAMLTHHQWAQVRAACPEAEHGHILTLHPRASSVGISMYEI